MKKYQVSGYVSANFGTLSGIGRNPNLYTTLDEAKTHCDKFDWVDEVFINEKGIIYDRKRVFEQGC